MNIRLMILILFIFLVVLSGGTASAQTLKDYFDQAQQLYDKGEYRKSIKLFEKVVDLDPNFAPAFNALGLGHLGIDDPIEDVVWFFKVAIDIDPNYAEAYSNMCRAYHDAKEWDSAELACLKALEIKPDLYQAQLSLAWVYLLGKSNPARALFYFEKLKGMVNSPTIYLGMGMAYVQQKDNARVLDIVTTLRGMGANDYASQLENDIRTALVSPKSVAGTATTGKTSAIIGKQPAPRRPSAVAADDEDAPLGPGQMRIRLKGRMQNSNSASGSAGPTKTYQRPASPKDHPGSL